MERFFNIAGPCNQARHYMAPAMSRLPEVSSLIRKEQYFVVHAQRQCGKTTAFLALTNEVNAGSDRVAVYCSLEAVQEFPRAEDGMPKICALLKDAINGMSAFGALAGAEWPVAGMTADEVIVSGVKSILSHMAARRCICFVADKPL